MYTILLTILTSLMLPHQPVQDNIMVHKGFIYEEAPFIECHASSIESTPHGMIATWFGGTKEANRDVEIWLSHYQDGKWSVPVSVANGIQHEGKRYPCWNPVLFQVPGGALMLFYKVGPSPSEWWGMLKESNDGGHTWSEGIRLPEDILGPIKNRPFLASDGRLICPSSTEVNPDEGWKLHFEVTPDLGKTWAITPSLSDPNGLNAIQPSILDHGDQVLQAVARSKDGGMVDSWSYDNGRTWSDVQSFGLPNPNSGTDAVTLREGFHLLVYNHSEKPANKWSGPRSPLNVAISVDGVQWETILELENEKGEYSYPAVVQAADGLIHITYTWKRRKIRHVILDPAQILIRYPDMKKKIEQDKIKKAQASAISVIFDTDVGNDIDDVLALAMLYNYQKQGKVNLLGITINKANAHAIPFIDIMNHYYGVKQTPVGFIGTDGPTPDDGKYLKPVVEARNKGKYIFKRKLHVDSKLPEAWKMQRKLLAGQPDHSVTIISVGFSSNLSRLLQSGADEYSPLSGYELVKKKVKLLSVMAGNFRDSTKAEYNVVKDIPSATYVFAHWPTAMIVGGWEVGAAIKYPATSIENDFKQPHPLELGYRSFLPMPYDRECWDLISVLVSVEGYQYGLSATTPGKVIANEKGGVVFVPGINGLQQYLVLDHQRKQELTDALVRAVTGK
ncbi:exo-alpha-sialidase [Bacteroides sp. 51]|uniref:exo-alpha-sialidase n=1 Tax=Bacteroides sp. 51 TaxID=2302938 RepID=UPI0013D1997C|nr:exo-alpha-sialidase [Bacteroides sp. 51]NDV80379.1 hypothetical protein [Bacteroides sp. 51]